MDLPSAAVSIPATLIGKGQNEATHADARTTPMDPPKTQFSREASSRAPASSAATACETAGSTQPGCALNAAGR
jgi:hypothetical protein